MVGSNGAVGKRMGLCLTFSFSVLSHPFQDVGQRFISVDPFCCAT